MSCNIDGNCLCLSCPESKDNNKKLIYFIDESENKSKPSGLFTKNCSTNSMFACSPYMMYDSRVGPDLCNTKCKVTDINQEMGIKKSICFDQNDPNTCGFTRKWDGRLVDSARNMKIGLDAPPYEGDIGELKNVYSKKLKNIKTGYYNSYEDINSGQIKYYSNSEFAGNFPKRTGNWILRSNEDYKIYKDPMDGVEIQVDRQPLTEGMKADYLCSQDFLKYSISQREDLMALQSHQLNKNRFNSRYGNLYKYN